MRGEAGLARAIVAAIAAIAAFVPLDAFAAQDAAPQDPAAPQPAAPERAPQSATLTAAYVGLASAADADQVVLVARNLSFELEDGSFALRADRAVLWGDRELLDLARGGGGADGAADATPGFAPAVPPAPGRAPLVRPAPGDAVSLLASSLHEIYAEGHVHFRTGPARAELEGEAAAGTAARGGGAQREVVLFAERLYHHLLEQRGIVVDADARTSTLYGGDPVALHVRAAALRSLGPERLAAESATFTTCAYGHPHYHVESGRLDVLLADPLERARTSGAAEAGAGETAAGAIAAPIVRTIALAENWLVVDETPWLPLPGFTTRLDAGEALPLKRIKAGSSSRFGVFLQTLWGADLPEASRALHESLELDPARPLSLEWELDVDGYARRGAGLGPALQWNVPGWLDGELGGYWIRDQRDEDFGIPAEVEHADRGRAYLRDRLTPVEHWRLDTEVQWYSDAGFQPEFFEREFKEEKEPESYAHLVRQEEHARWRFLVRDKLNDFSTQVDALPRLGLDRVGEPLFELPLPDALQPGGEPAHVVLTQAHDLAHLRLNPAEDATLGSERYFRGDSLLDLSTTLALGPVALRPFTAGRFTGWDRDADDEQAVGRAAGLAGARAEFMVHRDFDVWAPALAIDGLRHVALFDVDYVNVWDVSRDPDELVQIDDVDALSESEVWLLAVRQRLRTHRRVGDPGQAPAPGIEDVVEFDLELPLYPDAERDNVGPQAGSTAGRTAGPLRFDVEVRPGLGGPVLKNASLYAEGEWSHAERALDVINVGAALRPAPDWTTRASWRVVRGQSRVITGELDWQLTPRWSFAMLQQFELDTRDGLEHRLELRRHGHDFTFAFGFERDRGDGDLALTFTLYPAFLRPDRLGRTQASGRGDRPHLGD